MIHPTAIVEPGAQLGADCVIHPYAIIKKGAILGDRVTVHPFAVVGGDSQDLKFNPAVESGVRIGAGTVIRESVTVNRSTEQGSYTVVGEKCLLMACSHVGHDSELGRNVVLANCALIAGHVTVGDYAILGGGAAFHQFCRIGEGVMVGGVARITLDLPPFCLGAERNTVYGLNIIGLRRRGVPAASIRELKEAFRAVFFGKGGYTPNAVAALATGNYTTPEARRFLEFFPGSKRGFSKIHRGGAEDEGAG
jgi:UDP-N-acetylglucosamine acyltransferase